MQTLERPIETMPKSKCVMPKMTQPTPQAQTMDETILINRCKAGDKNAFDQLMRRYESRVYNFAMRLSGNRDDAGDITADTFVRVYKSLGSFRGESRFITWLFRIVTNIYIDSRKRKSVYLTQSFTDAEMSDMDDVSMVEQIEDMDMRPAELVEIKERNELLMSAISTLPQYQRMMVTMFHTNNQTYDEIAETLGLPLGTVKSRLNRARLCLRQKLISHQEYFQN